MRKKSHILFFIAIMITGFTLHTFLPKTAFSSESSCDNSNPNCLQGHSFYDFLQNLGNCDFFSPDVPLSKEDVCESTSLNEFPFDSTLYITALFHEAGNRIVVGQDSTSYQGSLDEDLIIFDTDPSVCFWNWGKWREFDFNDASLRFEDWGPNLKSEIFERNATSFQVCKLKFASKAININNKEIQLPKGTWLIGFDDSGNGQQDLDYQDLILAAKEEAFFSLQTSGNIVTQGDYKFFTKYDQQTQESPAKLCQGPGEDGWDPCKKIPLSEYLKTDKSGEYYSMNEKEVTTLSLPGEIGGVVFSDTSESSPVYCSGGWCYYY